MRAGAQIRSHQLFSQIIQRQFFLKGTSNLIQFCFALEKWRVNLMFNDSIESLKSVQKDTAKED